MSSVSVQPRREFLQGLVALPALGAVSLASASIEYEFNEFAVAGFPYYHGPAMLPDLHCGEALALVPEPDNPHDADAIRIEARGQHIGYVPRSENGPMMRLLRQGASITGRIERVDPDQGLWRALTAVVSLRL
jgi:hypothetical protein